MRHRSSWQKDKNIYGRKILSQQPGEVEIGSPFDNLFLEVVYGVVRQ
jgi:hypothetical protein